MPDYEIHIAGWSASAHRFEQHHISCRSTGRH
jgi:hypothetical protein